MKKTALVPLILALWLTGCESEQAKSQRLAQLTCETSHEGRSKEELTAITESCFRKGNFVKSSGKGW